MTDVNRIITGLVFALIMASPGGGQTTPPGPAGQSTDGRPQNAPQPFAWESPARLHHGLVGGTAGTLRVDSRGVEFVPLKGASKRWPFTEIKDLELQKHRVVLIGYDNRGWHLPGTQRFHLELTNEITPAVAASLTAEMGRPVRNMLPDPDAQANTLIAVRRADHFGGSNGLLRIRREGIDYVTAQPGQSRSWRWMDLQTLSNPDPYHLFVFGYRDTYAFDLKETLSRELFNRVSDEIWRHNESETMGSPVTHLPGAPTKVGRREDD